MSPSQAQKDTGRVEAFSDGVFAIAITLLILDVKVPHEPEWLMSASTGDANRWLIGTLGRQWVGYVAYLMSFVVILVMWVSHHRIFRFVRKTDHAFLFWNGLLLLLVSIVPFPTSLLASYFMTPAAKVAAAVYAGHGFLIASAFQGLWNHATRDGRLLAPGSEAAVARSTARYRFGPLMYFVTFVVAFVSASASIGLCLIFVVFFAVQGFLLDKE